MPASPWLSREEELRQLIEDTRAAAVPAWAQLATAELNGRVTDSSGAVLPGVTVTATQTATGLVRTVVTDENGGYLLYFSDRRGMLSPTSATVGVAAGPKYGEYGFEEFLEVKSMQL